jgi:hypothetical protein
MHVCNEELRDSNSPSSSPVVRVVKSRKLWWVDIARVGHLRYPYRISARKPLGKQPLRKPRGRRKIYIKVDIRTVDCNVCSWTEPAQNVLNSGLCFWWYLRSYC